MSTATTSIEQLAINTIRTLSMDAVQQANSGHPGTPMALAPTVYTLWNEFLRFDPEAPQWMDRDRFVLSCGHASMLLYSILHLAGVRKTDATGRVLQEPSVSLDDIRNFRQFASPCAGHPEFGELAGVETTTGPLGQGIANSVGLAASANWLAARYNRPDFELFGFRVYALCSDGDLMEGIGCEAASLAGHWKLSNLCWIYDDNHITIEGGTDLAFSENVAQRFAGLGWNTVEVHDANDLEATRSAFRTFQQTEDRPTIIILGSTIGYGAPNKANTADAHGAPLGEDEIRLAKAVYGWPEDEKFLVPPGVQDHFVAGIGRRGKQARLDWEQRFQSYGSAHPKLVTQINHIRSGTLPQKWDEHLPVFDASVGPAATRGTSGKVLNGLARGLPWLLGGSADLAPSTKTLMTDEEAGHFSSDNYAGRNFHFGVREQAMAAIGNGLALVGLRPYVATFFVFSDYLRPAMRLSAFMKQPVLYVFTHDSIGLGEDGPTHQPVEHLAAARAIPGLIVARPGDANEVTELYRALMPITDRPVAMVLTRQNISTWDRQKYAPAAEAARGAYVLSDSTSGEPELILIGTGSEVSLCLEAQDALAAKGTNVRVVSMPSWELFEMQEEAYRESVLPSAIKARIAVEAGIRQGWDRYIGSGGRFVGLSTYGASAPYEKLYSHFGITTARILEEAMEIEVPTR
ncbi:MAG: transketolase [Planctomycetaceae bacterium]|nr:transketolase [Planctomycetaceae bacterium]MBP61641.1 transketolase [Planctomycetaceae bacterium]